MLFDSLKKDIQDLKIENVELKKVWSLRMQNLKIFVRHHKKKVVSYVKFIRK